MILLDGTHRNFYPWELINMQVQLAYGFDSEQTAYRFLNDLRSGAIAGITAKLFRDGQSVHVSFGANDEISGFDRRCAELDDLAMKYQGSELTI